MAEGDRFAEAMLKLMLEHPGKVVWAGGWEGKFTVGWLDIPANDILRAKTALRAVMEDEGFELIMSNVDKETLRIEKNKRTKEDWEAEETVEELFLKFNQAISENPDRLVVMTSERKDPNNPKSEGMFRIVTAPDIADLQKMKELGWRVLCYSWKGENYEIKEGKVTPLKGLPMMH